MGAGERHVQCAPRGAVLKLGAYIHTAATRVAATEGEAESIGDADVTAADPAPGGAAGSSDADAGAAAADLAPGGAGDAAAAAESAPGSGAKGNKKKRSPAARRNTTSRHERDVRRRLGDGREAPDGRTSEGVTGSAGPP